MHNKPGFYQDGYLAGADGIPMITDAEGKDAELWMKGYQDGKRAEHSRVVELINNGEFDADAFWMGEHNGETIRVLAEEVELEDAGDADMRVTLAFVRENGERGHWPFTVNYSMGQRCAFRYGKGQVHEQVLKESCELYEALINGPSFGMERDPLLADPSSAPRVAIEYAIQKVEESHIMDLEARFARCPRWFYSDTHLEVFGEFEVGEVKEGESEILTLFEPNIGLMPLYGEDDWSIPTGYEFFMKLPTELDGYADETMLMGWCMGGEVEFEKDMILTLQGIEAVKHAGDFLRGLISIHTTSIHNTNYPLHAWENFYQHAARKED